MSNRDSIIHFCQRESEIDLTEAIAKARTEWLKNWLSEHLPEIASLKDTPSDHNKAREWDTMAKEMMKGRGLVTPEQQKNRITDIRNALSTLNPNHPALADVGFTAEQWEAINRPSEQRVSGAAALAQRDRNTKFLHDPSAIVEKAIALLDSYDWYDLAAGLAVLTGRRCAEILHTASFEYKSPYSVSFTGALKRRNEPVPLQFEIPTLASASVVIKALAKLRDWVDTKGLDNRAINNKYAHAVIKSCDRHFRDLVPNRDGKDNLYTHLFRAVYSTIASHWYCPPTLPELEFRAYIQGHFKILDEKNPDLRRSLAASRHYFDYKIADGQGNVDGRLGIKLSKPDVTVIETFSAYYQNPTAQTTDTTDDSPIIMVDNNHPSSVTTTPSPSSSEELGTQPQPISNSELIKTLVTMLDSKDYPILLTGLIGVTGLNPGELLKSGVFRLSPDGMVLFSPTGLTKSSPLPTLVSGEKVIDAIAHLRHHPDLQSQLYLSPSKINAHNHCPIEQVITQSLGLKDVEALYSTYSHLCSTSFTSTYHTQDPSLNPEQPIVTEKDWADVARSLAQSLHLDSPTQLQDWFDHLKTNSGSTTSPPPTPTQYESDDLKQMFCEQQKSLNRMTSAISNLVVTLKGEQTVTNTVPISKTPSSTKRQTTTPTTSVTSNPGEKKVNRAIDAIIDYNNNVATRKQDKWRIAISSLKQLTKCNQSLISRVIEDRRSEIEQHHQFHQLGQYHNSKGKSALSITEVIYFS